MGTSYTRLGDYERAASAYDRAFQLNLPFRFLWYQFGPFEAYFNTGRYDDVMSLVNANIANAGNNVEETFYWQGKVYAAQGRRAEATTSFQRAIGQNPNYEAASQALSEL
jgi:tetratricopeptide (TPR) repeat protein